MQQENAEAPPLARLPSQGFKRPGGFRPPGLVSQPNKKPAIAPRPALPLAKAAPQAAAPPGPAATSLYFSVLYTKYQPTKKLRKNKAFADGVLEVKASAGAAPAGTLYDTEGKAVTKAALRGYDPASLGNGSSVVMGGWELEVDAALPAEHFLSGEMFLKPCAATAAAAAPPPLAAGPAVEGAARPLGAAFKRPGMPGGGGGGGAFKRPGQPSAAASGPSAPPAAAPWLHDPRQEGAVVLNEGQWAQGAGKDAQGKLVAPVVVDPWLARQLRPHQVEGVRFLYGCTMGLRDPGQRGAILADAMGLGKTLTTLALVWTLLKQGPGGRPAVARALIVAPSSLTRNWAEEARKWLGNERMPTLILAPGPEGKQQVAEFLHGGAVRVAITSYETLRKRWGELAGGVGLVVADEGHRLKAAGGNKTISALVGLRCARRVLLTGTPIQNNMSEFYAMCDVVNPDVLGTLPVFERVFGGPIARSRDRDASAEDKALGAERSRELARRVETFVLRRGAEVNAAYLPPLALYVAFCRPSPLQARLLKQVLASGATRSLLAGGSGGDFGDQTLSVLTMLRKICNAPALHDADAVAAAAAALDADAGGGEGAAQAASPADDGHSGKLSALRVMLGRIVGHERGRCVVVSGSTAMLDLISQLCQAMGFATCRIDGGTDVNRRQDVVNAFNRHGVGQVFLLSTTAGGAGLNLTGANRLILVDSQWNPALDAQAMARIWRPGQKLPCVVYRLLTTGTLEEKVYQRQRAKGDIADVAMGADGGGEGLATATAPARGQFSREELRQLFTFRTDTACDTADVLGGSSGGAGGKFADCSAGCEDAPLAAAVAAGFVSFVHLEKTQVAGATAVALAESAVDPSGGVGPLGNDSGAGGDASELEIEDVGV